VAVPISVVMVSNMLRRIQESGSRIQNLEDGTPARVAFVERIVFHHNGTEKEKISKQRRNTGTFGEDNFLTSCFPDQKNLCASVSLR
jgi:hypothetical protein